MEEMSRLKKEIPDEKVKFLCQFSFGGAWWGCNLGVGNYRNGALGYGTLIFRQTSTRGSDGRKILENRAKLQCV